jgi:HlyD family secretion protein
MVLLMVLFFAILIMGVTWFSGGLFGRAPFAGPTWTVRKEKLIVTIIERGNLESAKNGDIVCTVRSGTKGSTNATTIKWIVDQGVDVKKGDKLIELDSSGFIEQLKDQNIKVDQAKADWITANENYGIQQSQNESDIETAKNALDLAKIDLEKYIKGDFIQSVKDVDGRIETARSDLENWKDRAAWSARMFKKGLMSKVQADADDSRVDGSRIALEKVQEEKRVLVDYMKKRTVQDLSAKLAEANRALDRVRSQAKAKLAQAEATKLSKDSVYQQEMSRKKEIVAEIDKCLVVAPQDGLVVYYVPEQVRGGGGSQQSIVAQGEPVREGQKMMQIPDLTNMLVNVSVHEAMVAYLHNEEDPEDKSTWQKAKIRVDAYASRVLHGHVKLVNTVASQQDFLASDVKVYKTLVSIDEAVEGLKPGMSAEVSIEADESPNEVMVIPIQSVVGTISMGANRKCFVIGADGQPHERDIVVGMSNQQIVEVKSGLAIGDKVVYNPLPFLSADSEMKPGKVQNKNENNDDDTGADGHKSSKKGKKKSAAPGGEMKGPTGSAPKAAGGPNISDEQKQAWNQKMQSATPAQRRDMINQMPDAVRDRVRQKLRDQGLDVAD